MPFECEESNEFMIFKVEKVRKQVIGRDRVYSENNIHSFPRALKEPTNTSNGITKNNYRKISMDVEYDKHGNDLIAPQINE